MESNISGIFSNFRDYLEKDQELREEIRNIVRNLEQAGREVVSTLQLIHKNGIHSEILSSCQQSRMIIERVVKPEYSKLKALLKSNPTFQYYRYHDSWRFINQRLVFAVSLIVFLESELLASQEEVAQILGIHCNKEDNFHLDLEDYLIGLLQLSSELSRLAVNSVIYGDYNRPVQISQFVTELSAGFRLLNLKNDSLRKRFDALKYDVKKIEEIVYDLSIRGLKSSVDVEPSLDAVNK